MVAESKGIGKEPIRIEEFEGSNFAEKESEQGWEVGISSTRGVVSVRGIGTEIGQVGESKTGADEPEKGKDKEGELDED